MDKCSGGTGTMNDTKTLIRSSILSLIIIVLGLFMLCIGGAPKVNIDEPLIEGGDLSDDEFMSLLESADNEITQDEAVETTDDSYMYEESDETSAATSDDELADILELLNMAESEGDVSEPQGPVVSEQASEQELERLLYDSDDSEYADNEGKVDAEAYSDLESEINKLEQILIEKDSQVDSIKFAIEEYDEQIAEIEGGKNYPGGSSSKGNVNYTSYSDENFSNSASQQELGYSDPGGDNGFTRMSGAGNARYDDALNYFHNGEYQIAATTFKRLLHENPNSPLADNCQYWIGECRFAQGKYYQAIVEFEKVFMFNSTDKHDDAQIMMGLAYMKAGQVQQARTDFTWLLACYEGSEYYQRALRYMNEL
ncbi:tetratricopeptide repeat protein [candidate division KSB1 bacterium]|nr:tetratricopeptide repeat protein [candidate division KSB1 bacterium]